MNDCIIQFVLGQNDTGIEGIVEIVIFIVIIVGGIIKSLVSAKQQQNQKQKQKKPVTHSSIRGKPPASAEKIRMQRERVEQFHAFADERVPDPAHVAPGQLAILEKRRVEQGIVRRAHDLAYVGIP